MKAVCGLDMRKVMPLFLTHTIFGGEIAARDCLFAEKMYLCKKVRVYADTI